MVLRMVTGVVKIGVVDGIRVSMEACQVLCHPWIVRMNVTKGMISVIQNVIYLVALGIIVKNSVIKLL